MVIRLLFLISLAFLCSCSLLQKVKPAANTKVAPQSNEAANRREPVPTPSPAVNINANVASAAAKKACMKTETGDDVVMESQTFPVDFEPFAGDCFVTTYNPEYDDPPMESHYAIYRKNKKVFDFPEQFNGATFGCWVDGVSFQDLNDDELKDVIVVGKCSTKGGPYNENMVYINTGKSFITRPDGNNRLSDFASIKEISDFAQDNQQIFFK